MRKDRIISLLRCFWGAPHPLKHILMFCNENFPYPSFLFKSKCAINLVERSDLRQLGFSCNKNFPSLNQLVDEVFIDQRDKD